MCIGGQGGEEGGGSGQQQDGKATDTDSGKPKDGEGANANTSKEGGEVSVCVCVCVLLCAFCALCALYTDGLCVLVGRERRRMVTTEPRMTLLRRMYAAGWCHVRGAR